MANSLNILPVILSGGAGTRLWPMSRALYPKQLLPLVSNLSLLQETAKRVEGDGFLPPLIVCNEEHRFIVAEQMRELGIRPEAILLEPEGRNTAPAAALAALIAEETHPGAVMLLLPSDHEILDSAAFLRAAGIAARAAAEGALATFGIAAKGPETGYGYIKKGGPWPGLSGCFKVERFVEKPDRARAEAMLAEGGYFWNGGLFAFTAGAFLGELKRLQPAMLEACRAALTWAKSDLDFRRVDPAAFAKAAAISIDYAVMEHTGKAATVPVEMGWSDVGSWSALWEIAPKDPAGNVSSGDVVQLDSKDSYLRTDAPLLACVGVENLVVVATHDAVLVAAKDKVQDVKKLVDLLKEKGRSEPHNPPRTFRPWGYYQGIDRGDRFQVKHIFVKPGAALSLQMHHHRAEHWIVVEGTAKVIRDGETILLHENQSTYIPIGVAHRLENPGKVPLRLIEVQSGAYLGEDDIVRFEDNYGRK